MLKPMFGKFIYISLIFYSHLNHFGGLGFQTIKIQNVSQIWRANHLDNGYLKRENFNVKQVLMGFGIIMRL